MRHGTQLHGLNRLEDELRGSLADGLWYRLRGRLWYTLLDGLWGRYRRS